jgi:hypothetical protein
MSDDLESVPADGWNQFIDRYCMLEYRDVPAAYKPAYVFFRYFSEVYNGGHLQFFVNVYDLPPEAVSSALAEVAGPKVAANFDDALTRWRTSHPEPRSELPNYFELVGEMRFEAHDQFIACLEPVMEDRLLKYLIERKLI